MSAGEQAGADLTVDNLCAALRHFLEAAAASPPRQGPGEPPSDKLTLWGTPGDPVMRAVLDAFGGSFTVTVREMPVAMAVQFPRDAVLGQDGCAFWSPET